MNEGSFSGGQELKHHVMGGRGEGGRGREEGESQPLLYNLLTGNLSEQWVGSTHMGPLLQELLVESDRS